MSAWLNDAERVADVVQERAGDVVVVAVGSVGAGRGLQRVGEPVDREAAVVAVEEAEVVHHAVGEAGVEGSSAATIRFQSS